MFKLSSYPAVVVVASDHHQRKVRRPDDHAFLLTHLWLPLLVVAALLCMLALTDGDAWLADRLYALQGHGWTLRKAFLTETVMHRFGRDVSAVAWLAVLVLWIVSTSHSRLRRWRAHLGYLAIATLLASLLVAWVKSWSNMDCPWDLIRYGGERPFIGLLEIRPVGLSRGACFPAGHASAGYAWVALYFGLRASRAEWRWAGLCIGLGLGMAFGVTQQLRGAHFLSHDIWTAAICWFTALGVYLLFRERLAAKRAAPEFDQHAHLQPPHGALA